MLRVASVVGVRHRLAGQPSDDGYAWAHGPGTLVMAVADGVGAVPGSAAAAARACGAAVTVGLERSEGENDPGEVVRAALAAGNQAAAEGTGATTLVVAVLQRDGRASMGRVGDSTAFLVEQAGPVAELFDPPDPDRADTATAALPDVRAGTEIRSVALSGQAVLVLATDGVADPWRDGPGTVAPALADAVREHPGPLQLLAVTDFSRQGCHDDRTILCVWMAPGG